MTPLYPIQNTAFGTGPFHRRNLCRDPAPLDRGFTISKSKINISNFTSSLGLHLYCTGIPAGRWHPTENKKDHAKRGFGKLTTNENTAIKKTSTDGIPPVNLLDYSSNTLWSPKRSREICKRLRSSKGSGRRLPSVRYPSQQKTQILWLYQTKQT